MLNYKRVSISASFGSHLGCFAGQNWIASVLGSQRFLKSNVLPLLPAREIRSTNGREGGEESLHDFTAGICFFLSNSDAFFFWKVRTETSEDTWDSVLVMDGRLTLLTTLWGPSCKMVSGLGKTGTYLAVFITGPVLVDFSFWCWDVESSSWIIQ